MDGVLQRRRALGTIFTTLKFVVIASVFGIAALSFSQQNYETFTKNLSFSFSSDINRIQESLVIENAVYHNSTSSFNVTLDNTGYEGISIQNVTLRDISTNKLINLNATAVNTGSSNCSPGSSTPIVLDNSGQTVDDTSGSTSTTLSSFTIGSGTNRLLLVAVHMEDQTVTVSSVTYGGVNLSQVTTSTGTTSRTELWKLVNPNSGTANIVVNLNNNNNINEVIVGAVSYTGVDQNNPIPTTAPVVGGGSGTEIDEPITTTYANSWIVDAITWNAESSVSAISGQTQTYQVDGSNFVGAGSYFTMTSPGSKTIKWSSSSHTFSALAVEVKASGGTTCSSGSSSSIALDAASSFSIGKVSSYTYTHTVGTSLSNSILVVGVSVSKQNGRTVSSIIDTTDNNAALNKAIAFSGGSGMRAEIWYLTNPPSGANSIKITFSGQIGSDGATVGTVSLSGVDQNNPIGATATGGATSGNPSASITTINDNAWLIDTVAYDIQNDAATPGSGQNQQWQLNGGASVGMEGFGSTKSTNTHGSNSMSWTVSNSNNWGMVVVEIKPASTSGSSGSSSSPLLIPGSICTILPRQSCTVSVGYHDFTHPVLVSVTTSRGNVYTSQVAPVVSWYDTHWMFRKEITINNAQVSGTLTNFPVLINIADPNLASNAQSSGNDIMFTAWDGKTPLNYEIEHYTSSTGSLQAWVEIPTLYSTPNDVIYMYYGNQNIIQPYVALTLTNSQSSATPVPFQQEITFNPSKYTGSEAANLGNIRFCADMYCNTTLYSWLENCTPSCTNTATQATAWVNLSSAIPANGVQRIYMVFQPTSTNFDGNYWGESYQISTSYDNIAKVMNTGLLEQIYYYSGGTCGSSGYQNQLYNAAVGNGVTVSGCASFVSSTNPFTTPATGSSQNINTLSGNPQGNVIINYQTGYSGGGSWPNPPVSDTSKSWDAKAIGWSHVTSSTTMYLELDDGGTIGTSTTQGGFTTGGANWLGGNSNPNNVISSWKDQSATEYSGTASTGDDRIETDYYENGGQTYFGMWSSASLQYYSIAYPPNGVMPTVTINTPWDSNYVGVWHFKEDPSGTAPQMKDSTTNGNHLTASGMTSANQVAGQIDGSLNYISSNSQYLYDTSPTGLPANNAAQTESAWFWVLSNPSSTQNIFVIQNSGSSSAVQMGFISSNFAIWKWGGSTLVTSSPPAANSWHYAVYTYDGTTNRLYIDGVQVTSSTTSPQTGTPNAIYIGTYSVLSEFFNGQVDESRVSNVARSANWISTEYNNQAFPSSFYIVGNQQTETDPRSVP
jgi:hypothetical protein